jgi:aminoglycoside phosphotransferase family enzyme
MSWVFMAGDRVYKLKKPVKFPYLDFSTLSRREAACRAEFLLNRRLARDVYLEVAPLTIGAAGLKIGGDGAVVDWLVVMRRLEQGGTLEDALAGGNLQSAQADAIAATLAAFYAHAQRLHIQLESLVAGWRRAAIDNERVLLNLRFHLPHGALQRIAYIQRRFLDEHAELLHRRLAARLYVDAHGDLRPEHIWLRDPITVIDCLEFDARLRALDPLDEIAYLHLECERLGARWAGERIRTRLRRTIGDKEDGLFEFYRCQRAVLRARLSIAHLLDSQPREPEKWRPLARAYLRLAAADGARLERLLKKRGDRRKPYPAPRG